jgi:hypothetical protein
MAKVEKRNIAVSSNNFDIISESIPMKTIAPTKKGEKKKTATSQSCKQGPIL